mmetsp:Transcript_12377/g.29229  ORF Transcript_12377/g.29229 Transcript_12377/m.29229 type:complete len:230 (-) Transcript_12377:30-719(-)
MLRRLAVAILCVCIQAEIGDVRAFKRVGTHRSGAETKPKDGVAPTKCRCRLYIFDINAFLIHEYTSRQIRERTYEGLGGKRFVRLPQNGLVLNRWVRLVLTGAIKREQCILCGHTHMDHLKFRSWLDRDKTKAFDDHVTDKSQAGWYKRYIEPTKKVGTRRGKSKERAGADDAAELQLADSIFKQLPQYKPKHGSNVLDRSLHSLSITTCLFRLRLFILRNLLFSEQES